MKISKELSTGTLPMLVLSVLGSEDLYGYRIIKILEARSDNAFSLKEGTLYPILHALEQEGCLESYWDASTGRKKNTIILQRKGASCWRAKRRSLPLSPTRYRKYCHLHKG